jgi:hypothetical protein
MEVDGIYLVMVQSILGRFLKEKDMDSVFINRKDLFIKDNG